MSKNESLSPVSPLLAERLRGPFLWADCLLENRLMLAPMAGATGMSYRKIARRWGAAYGCTELCSAAGICHDPDFKRSRRYLDISDEDAPTAIQLFGHDAETMVEAVERVLAHPCFGKAAAIDINMGCPVDKVVKTGAGSALMRDAKKAENILRAAVRAAEPFRKKVTVKIRSGWSETEINAADFAARMEAAGAAAIALHARTRKQLYQGKADWRIFPSVRARLTVPLAANGDIARAEHLLHLLEENAADAFMIGRAAIGNPWIFRCLLEGRNPESPPAAVWEETVMTQLEEMMAQLGELRGLREFRPSLAAYLRGFPSASALRDRCMREDNPDELRQQIREMAASLPHSESRAAAGRMDWGN